MKNLKTSLLILVFSLILVWPSAIMAQEEIVTENYGLGAFANSTGPIKLAVDASLAIKQIDSPYVMFIIYMASGEESRNIVVGRDGITMIYQDKEYKMPTLEELRKNYGGQIRDIDFSRVMGKEGIASTWIRFYQFPQKTDFFPPPGITSRQAVDEGSMTGLIGFRTRCYFKNPGFKKGDRIIIRVRAKNDPDISNEVAVILE
ncbi:MAG: hypothetical protein PHU81_07015 [Acidobacteriota bacterium]|nr:hypothetical protein [Acidobacteriota bacterium]